MDWLCSRETDKMLMIENIWKVLLNKDYELATKLQKKMGGEIQKFILGLTARLCFRIYSFIFI